jgi:tetratricopeptide (TPR) repeat protein
MYLPLCAVIALVVIGGYWILSVVGPPRRGGQTPARSASGPYHVAAILLAAFAVAGCAYLTSARNGDYSSYERIWADTVAKRPENARARSNYGTVLFEQARVPEAETQLRKAVEIREAYPEAQANLGAVLCSQGRLEEGIAHLKRAIALEPTYRDAYRNLGEALASTGRNAEALEAYRRALVSAPNDPRLLSRIAWLMATSPEDAVRDGRQALTLAERAVQITDGRDADSLDTLAAAYAEMGQYTDAGRTEERAIETAQSSGMAHMIPEMQIRLEMYRAGQRFRQAPPQRG